MKVKIAAYIDGASRGNPGPSAVGIFISDSSGNDILRRGEFIGQTTNNVAEYTALIYALQEAIILKANKVKVYSDSELLCRQMTGAYKVRHINLKPLFEQVKHLANSLGSFEIKHIPRTENQQADKLAKRASEQAKY